MPHLPVHEIFEEKDNCQAIAGYMLCSNGCALDATPANHEYDAVGAFTTQHKAAKGCENRL